MTKNDLDTFWKSDAEAKLENCFNSRAAQVSLGIRMSEECVYSELNEPGDPWNIAALPLPHRIELNKRYNEKAVQTVGIPLLPEKFPPPEAIYPPIKRIGEVFGGIYETGYRTGEWLHHKKLHTPEDLSNQLDLINIMRADGYRGLKQFIYPENWEQEKKRIREEFGLQPPLLRHIRGPVTLATSLFGLENLSYLAIDNTELFIRFGNTIKQVILAMAELSDREAGYTNSNFIHGFSFADDDCSLFTPEMYHVFGYPVLKAVFGKYSPEAEDMRFQHSDSAMAHLLPQLGSLNLNGCNFGPTVLVEEIREFLPCARIDGCIAPFTFMNNDRDFIRTEVKRDCEAVKKTGTRGLNVFTAGSINDGSSLESMLTIMEAISEFGTYP